MKKSATEIMQEIVFAAVVDAIDALKARSKGVPNNLLRDLNALHANTAFADLPPELQAAVGASTRAAFARLLKEGYSVSAGEPARGPARPQGEGREGRPQRREGPREGAGPRRDGPGGGRPGRGRPGGGAKPGGGGPKPGGGGSKPGGGRPGGRPQRPGGGGG